MPVKLHLLKVLTLSIKYIVYIILIIGSVLYDFDASANTPHPYHLIESGRYINALDLMKIRLSITDNPYDLEAALYQIRELSKYQECLPKALSLLGDLKNDFRFINNPTLIDRLDILYSELLFRKGDIYTAQTIVQSFDFFNFYVMGPFKSGTVDEFNTQYPPERYFKSDQVCSGYLHTVTWFTTHQDRLGIISLSDLIPNTKDTFFYLYQTFTISTSGSYQLLLGKSGFTDIWIDGTRVFSNRRKHAFDHGQYAISVDLGQGTHTLLIKIGDSPSSGISCAIRLIDHDGKRVKHSLNYSASSSESFCKPISSSFFPALKDSLANQSTQSELLERAAFLLYASRIGHAEDAPLIKFLSRFSPSHHYYSYLAYQIAMLEKLPEKREYYLKLSLDANPTNLEGLFQLFKIKLERGYAFQAHTLIDTIKSLGHNSPIYYHAKALLYSKCDWQLATDDSITQLLHSEYPSLGYSIKALAERRSNNLSKALQHYQQNLTNEININDLQSLIEIYEQTAHYPLAIETLHRAINYFPNKISLRIQLARIITLYQGISASIPYYSSALARSPQHPEILKRLGESYYLMGNRSAALYYIDQSLTMDPDNHSLRLYLDHLRNTEDVRTQYAAPFDRETLEIMAKPYASESALYLLDETLLSIHADGTYDKKIRKVIQINDRNAIDEFKNLYVVFDPHNESLSGIVCRLTKGQHTIDITEYYHKSLSDPDARLYYNLVAHVIPLTSIDAGTTIELSYTIRNRESKEYKIYYGERFTVGGQHRHLLTNFVIVYPKNKQIYCHLKKISPLSRKSFTKDTVSIQQIMIKNLAGYTKEPSMPPDYDVLPAIILTSSQSWQEFYQWYRSLLADKIIINDEMRAFIKEIQKTTPSLIDRARKICNHVISRTRYVGFEFGLGGIQPRRTDQIYHSRMGDCKDIALLLVAMLRESGIDADLALIRTRDRGNADISIPSVSSFNHAICYIHLNKGFFVDGTAKFSSIEELPSEDRDVTVMVIGKSNFSFIKTSSDFYHNNTLMVKTAVTLSHDGSAIVTRSMNRTGSIASPMRQMLNQTDEAMQTLTTYWNSVFPGSSISNLIIQSKTIDLSPSYSYTVFIPTFSQISDKMIVFYTQPVPSGYLQEYGTLKSRTYPLILGSPLETTSITHYRIPRGYHVHTLPPNEKFHTNDYSAEFLYTKINDTIQVTAVIRINVYQLDTDAYNHFRSFITTIRKKELERIILLRDSD